MPRTREFWQIVGRLSFVWYVVKMDQYWQCKPTKSVQRSNRDSYDAIRECKNHVIVQCKYELNGVLL